MMKWRGCRYQRNTTLLLIEKHLERQGGGGGCRRCWGLSDTRLIRGSSSEVVVCTMKHVDGPTMTHMLRLTGVDLDMGEDLKKRRRRRRKKKKNPRPQQRVSLRDRLRIFLLGCLCVRPLIGLICGKMHCHYSYPALTD